MNFYHFIIYQYQYLKQFQAYYNINKLLLILIYNKNFLILKLSNMDVSIQL